MPDSADDVTRGFIVWAGSVLPGLAVTSRTLSDKTISEGVDVRLLGLEPRPSPRVANPPMVVALDYLVTVRAADPFAEQHAAAELLFAALDLPDCTIRTDLPAPALIATLGLTAAPAFILQMTLLRPRAAHHQAPLVRFPVVFRTTDIHALEGEVRGPEDVPVAAARVSLPGSRHSTRTDARGRFRLPGVPSGGDPVELEIQARGVTAKAEARPGHPVVIRLPLEV
ncbi:MAG: carboxypeptidase regulatory-like domain-containing protein [Inquilinus limosus]|uniref:Carboxypeptidase regulatory-like domain-containing protein n=1 Tax=Inquilinus limosus TaxID=171674 RepID=A0A952KD23_9PROT|nr:carboxypeptidase regulatory-like domain-containing protein [Inquilinus limosus]